MTLTRTQALFFERVDAAQREHGYFTVAELATGYPLPPGRTQEEEEAHVAGEVEEFVALDLVTLVTGTDAFYKLTAKGKKLADKRPWEIRRLKD